VPSADYQVIFVLMRAVPQYDASFPIQRLLKSVDSFDSDEGTPMNANKIRGKFLLERLKRIADQVLAVSVMHTDIFLICAEDAYFANRYQQKFTMYQRAHVFSARFDSRLAREPAQCVTRQPCSLPQSAGESLSPYRLQNVAYRTRVERVDRVLVIRGCKHDGWRVFHGIEVMCGLDSVDSGHADVEQHCVRLKLGRERERLLSVCRFADDLVIVKVFENLP
jgi:hypothetical protein